MKINVYIGYDKNQDYHDKFNEIKNSCYEVCKASILKYSNNVNIDA